MRENQRSMNPAIARLDREARRIGLEFRRQPAGSCNSREFQSVSGARLWRFAPGGKGVIHVRAFMACDPDLNDGNSWALDAVAYVAEERARSIMYKALTVGYCPDAPEEE